MLAAQRTSACGHIVSVKHQKQQQKRYRIDINFHIFSVFAAVCFSAQSPQPVLMNLFFFFLFSFFFFFRVFFCPHRRLHWIRKNPNKKMCNWTNESPLSLLDTDYKYMSGEQTILRGSCTWRHLMLSAGIAPFELDHFKPNSSRQLKNPWSTHPLPVGTETTAFIHLFCAVGFKLRNV